MRSIRGRSSSAWAIVCGVIAGLQLRVDRSIYMISLCSFLLKGIIAMIHPLLTHIRTSVGPGPYSCGLADCKTASKRVTDRAFPAGTQNKYTWNGLCCIASLSIPKFSQDRLNDAGNCTPNSRFRRSFIYTIAMPTSSSFLAIIEVNTDHGRPRLGSR
jgi:hypothetical protein